MVWGLYYFPGSDMEADDTIAAADENAIFEEVDDAGDDVTDPFADLDDNCKKVCFKFETSCANA